MMEYPNTICFDCGVKYGKPKGYAATFHIGICGWCGETKSVTEPRDYGYPPAPDETLNPVVPEIDF